MTTTPSLRYGALFGLAAFAAFSTHDVFVKALGETYAPAQILFFTALMSFPLITLLLMLDDRPATLRPVHPWWVAARSAAAAVTVLLAFHAFSVLPLAEVYVFIFASPLIITVLAVPLLGEKVGFRRGLAVLAGLGGVLIALNPGASEIQSGHIAALGAAFFGGLNAIIVRKIGGEERPVVMILYPMLANLILAACLMPVVYVDLRLPDLGLFAIVASLALAAMSSLVVAYTRAPAILVAPTQYSQIIWAVIYGALIFDEWPDARTMIGVAVIVGSGVYILRREASGVSLNSPVTSTRTRIGHAVAVRVGHLLDRKR